MALEYDNIKDEMTALRKAVQGDDAETGEYGSIQAELQAIRKAVESGWGSGGGNSSGGGVTVVDISFDEQDKEYLNKTAGELFDAFQNGVVLAKYTSEIATVYGQMVEACMNNTSNRSASSYVSFYYFVVVMDRSYVTYIASSSDDYPYAETALDPGDNTPIA